MSAPWGIVRPPPIGCTPSPSRYTFRSQSVSDLTGPRRAAKAARRRERDRTGRGPQTVKDGRLDDDEALAVRTMDGPQRRVLGQRRADGVLGGGVMAMRIMR